MRQDADPYRRQEEEALLLRQLPHEVVEPQEKLQAFQVDERTRMSCLRPDLLGIWRESQAFLLDGMLSGLEEGEA